MDKSALEKNPKAVPPLINLGNLLKIEVLSHYYIESYDNGCICSYDIIRGEKIFEITTPKNRQLLCQSTLEIPALNATNIFLYTPELLEIYKYELSTGKFIESFANTFVGAIKAFENLVIGCEVNSSFYSIFNLETKKLIKLKSCKESSLMTKAWFLNRRICILDPQRTLLVFNAETFKEIINDRCGQARECVAIENAVLWTIRKPAGFVFLETWDLMSGKLLEDREVILEKFSLDDNCLLTVGEL